MTPPRAAALSLYAHPFSSYCQKVLIALWENELPFTYRHLQDDPSADAERKALWPLDRFPVLVDGDRTIVESSIIIEHLGLHHPGPVRLLPGDPRAALEVRFLDRVFDQYVMSPVQQAVFAAMRESPERAAQARASAAERLELAYAWLERRLEGRTWAGGEAFSLADCAAAPALFYADWVHEIGPGFPTVRAYRRRLLERPSFHRCVEEGRPYRAFFPLGAPDRD